MPPPHMPPKKHSSEDTSTSSGTSVGILEKKKAVLHWMKDTNEEGNEQRNTMTTEDNEGTLYAITLVVCSCYMCQIAVVYS